jgi:broad-specificity NMP kinase
MEIMGENSLRSSRVLGNNDVIIIVTGLPRSGTSMMMAMLRACGIPLLTDGERVANQDNPKGYFEYEQVKNLNDGDYKWLSKAKGKAVKVISYLLLKLPGTFRYRVIFIHRKLDEILASQNKMLINRGEDPDKISEDEMKSVLVRHLQQVEEWIENQSNIDRINVDYNRMLENPDEDIQRLSSFLGNSINIESLRDVIDPKLYRQRF